MLVKLVFLLASHSGVRWILLLRIVVNIVVVVTLLYVNTILCIIILGCLCISVGKATGEGGSLFVRRLLLLEDRSIVGLCLPVERLGKVLSLPCIRSRSNVSPDSLLGLDIG